MGHKEGAKFGGGGAREHSSRTKSSESGHGHQRPDHQYHGNRHRGGNGSLDSSSSTSGSSKSDSRIWSSNRFEKLEVDPDHENFSTSIESSTSGENCSKSSPSTSSTSLTSSMGCSTSASSAGSSSSSHKASGDDRKPGKGRGGKGNPRGRGLMKYQDSGDSGGRSVGHAAKEREAGKEEGGQRKRSPKQIKFDLPPNAEGKEQEQVGRHGGDSPDPAKSDASSNNEVFSDITSKLKTGMFDGRIIYDRVSHVHVMILCCYPVSSTGNPTGLQIILPLQVPPSGTCSL